ncbi:MAG: PEP-CTERM sorting domain-containing protein [Verrucomicrobiota bacterium]
MKKTIILAVALTAATVHAQVFHQDFDGGYPGGFGLASYGAGGTAAPISPSTSVVGGVGNPNAALQISMTTAEWGTYYAGQLQEMTVSGNTDPTIANYTLSFDIKGSQAANVQMAIQSWAGQYFGGAMNINSGVNFVLSAVDTWQTVSYNLGSLAPGANPTGSTWQFGFQINAWEWNGPNLTDTLTIDNVKLSVVPEPTTVTLAGLSAVAMLIFRRRQA